MTNNQPLVSVLMTAYNREKYIGEAIESVLESSYQNFELIVVDDCSTDNTASIVQSYANQDSRVFYYRNKENLGDYPNRNKAASYAKGEYIKYLDSDDYIYPHGLAVMVSAMEKYSEAGFGLSENGYEHSPHPLCLTPYQSYRENFFERDLFGRAPSSSIIRTKAFNDVGGFTGKRQVGDHEMWLMMGRGYSLVTLPRDLAWNRVHADQEQKYDDVFNKTEMHWSIQQQALEHEDCPLTQKEVASAYSILNSKHAKTFWRTMYGSAGIRGALRYRKALQLRWLDLPFSMLSNVLKK